MSSLQIKSSSRRENSEKCLINIEENKTEIKQSTDVSKQKVAAFLIRAKEAEIISLASLQSRLSHIIQDQKNFEEQTVGKIDSFKTFASSLINDLKKVSFQVPQVSRRVSQIGIWGAYIQYPLSEYNVIYSNNLGCSIRFYSQKSRTQISSKNY